MTHPGVTSEIPQYSKPQIPLVTLNERLRYFLSICEN
jgi:hypothetical protein